MTTFLAVFVAGIAAYFTTRAVREVRRPDPEGRVLPSWRRK